jgi:hypothetical protein
MIHHSAGHSIPSIAPDVGPYVPSYPSFSVVDCTLANQLQNVSQFGIVFHIRYVTCPLPRKTRPHGNDEKLGLQSPVYAGALMTVAMI